MRCAYLGADPRSYPDYTDIATGLMLYAAPGGTYGIRGANGRTSLPPLPPNDGRWEPAGAPPDGPSGTGGESGTVTGPAALESRESPARVAAELQAGLAAAPEPTDPGSEA